MRYRLIAALVAGAALSGCAHGMGHAEMSHEEMMRHCQMMEQHQAQAGQGPAQYDPAQHGGMSHEEMMRHCASMRDAAPHSPAH